MNRIWAIIYPLWFIRRDQALSGFVVILKQKIRRKKRKKKKKKKKKSSSPLTISVELVK